MQINFQGNSHVTKFNRIFLPDYSRGFKGPEEDRKISGLNVDAERFQRYKIVIIA